MLFVREDVIDRYSELIKKANCEVYEVTESVYDKLSDEKAPQGIFTVSRFLDNIVFVDGWTGKGAIKNMTLEELREYDFGKYKGAEFAGTKIPTLDEFLEVSKKLGDKMKVLNIEIKRRRVLQTKIATYKLCCEWRLDI